MKTIEGLGRNLLNQSMKCILYGNKFAENYKLQMAGSNLEFYLTPLESQPPNCFQKNSKRRRKLNRGRLQ